jgi:hypothetical protein
METDQTEVRLWDTQWMNIVNHERCYADFTKEEAVAMAVKLTEEAIARNIADGKLPPKRVKPK